MVELNTVNIMIDVQFILRANRVFFSPIRYLALRVKKFLKQDIFCRVFRLKQDIFLFTRVL